MRNGVAVFIARRVGILILTLFVASILIFGALYIAPADPISFLTKGRALPAHEVNRLREEFGLNHPIYVRYWNWITGALGGDFGRSIINREPVGTLIASRLQTTILLGAYSAILITVGGVGIGAVAANRSSFLRNSAVVGSSVGLATPSFVAAVFLIDIFAVNLGWFPVYGPGSGFGDRLWHLTLPAIALSISLMAYMTRITQAAVVGEQHSEHVETARSRGIPTRVVNRRHVLRNALMPILTAGGIAVAGILAAMVVVEQAFGLNGIGSLMFNSVVQGDFAVVQATALIFVAAFVVLNTMIDVAYAFLDPRVGDAAGAGG